MKKAKIWVCAIESLLILFLNVFNLSKYGAGERSCIHTMGDGNALFILRPGPVQSLAVKTSTYHPANMLLQKGSSIFRSIQFFGLSAGTPNKLAK